MGLINLPIPLQTEKGFPIIQYADDTLIIMEGDPRQLFFLKTILQNFCESTRLKVNYSKSMMLPINVNGEKLDMLSRTFGCSKGLCLSPILVCLWERLSQKLWISYPS